MSTAEATPDLRPLRIGEILDVAIKIYTKNAGTLFKLVAAAVVPVQVIGVLVILSTLPDSLETIGQNPFGTDPSTQVPQVDAGDLGLFLAGNLIVGILTFIGTTLATGASFKAISDAYLGAKPEWRSSIRFALSHLRSLVWLTFIATLIAGVALLFCIVPGVWLWAAWSVAVPVLLMERLKGTKALGRSFNLTQGRWWPTFVVMILAFLLALIVSSIFSGAITALTFTDAGDNLVLVQVLNGIATTIGSIIATPFQAAVVAVLYFDLRVRKEGFDLALLAQRIGTELPGGPRAALLPPPIQPAAYAGQPPPPPGYAQPGYPPPGYPQSGYLVPQTNGLATAALIVGILGLTFCFGLGGIAALVLGYMAKHQIDVSQGMQAGRGMAIAGIVMGWIAVGLSALIVLAVVAAN